MEPKPLAEWTLMIYMAGDNNLSAECVWALTEMKKAASSDKINVIAQFDPCDSIARTRRYEINKDGLHSYQQSSNGHKPLNEDLVDFANWNPRTREVHFEFESRKANSLANKRRKERDAQEQSFHEMMVQGQGLNAFLTPDDPGASLNESNAASPVTLYNFLSFGVQFYPARHYMIVLSGHSAGIQPSYLLSDASSGGYMTFKQLKAVFEQLEQDLTDEQYPRDGRAGMIDILGFDTCLMSMAEICYELFGLVRTVIGSESYTPASGWPYRFILDKLCHCVPEPEKGTASKTLTPTELAAAIVESYVEYYKDYETAGVSVALSALDVTKTPGLVTIVKQLTTALMQALLNEHPEVYGERAVEKHPFTDTLLLAHWEAQSYNGEWYVDLVDFCECLSRRCSGCEVYTACRRVIEYVKDYLVIKSCVVGATYQYSNGAAIYFPWAGVSAYFWSFEFARKSGWGDFLALYTNVTRRTFRVPDKPTVEQLAQIRRLEALGANYLNYIDPFKENSGFDIGSFNRMGSDKMGSDKMGSDKMGSDKMGSDKMGSDKMGSDKMGSDKMGSDKMGSDKMGSDKMGSDKMGSDKMGNPIHSMRNPPIVAIDFDC